MDRKSCSRKISAWFITFPAGILKDSTETAACAKAITDHLKVYCKSKEFAAEVIIYASDKSSNKNTSVSWHLHILLLALPGSTVRKEIEKFCTNKYRCTLYSRKILDIEKVAEYIKPQSSFKRCLICDPKGELHHISREKVTREQQIIDDITYSLYGFSDESEKKNSSKNSVDFVRRFLMVSSKKPDFISVSWLFEDTV